MRELEEAIRHSDSVERDIIWTILKRKDPKFGILRKLVCMSRVFDLDESSVVDGAEKDETGRILDKPNRMIICEALEDAVSKVS